MKSRLFSRPAILVLSLLLLQLRLLLASSSGIDQGDLMFEERFNTPPLQLEYLNGSKIAADSSGVSGKLGDSAYLSGVVSQAEKTPGPVARILKKEEEQSLKEITLTMWFNGIGMQSDVATLLGYFGIVLINDKTFTVRLEAEREPQTQGNWVTVGRKGPLGEWIQPGQWNFFAFTWKFATQTAVIYQGTPSGFQVVSTRTTNVTGPIQVKPKLFGGIGNSKTDESGKQAQRPFSGYIDDVRIFSKALDENSIKAIYQADLKNESIKAP